MPAMLAAVFLIAMVAALAVVIHISPAKEPMESGLLQKVQSASYYARMAAADDWMLGPKDHVQLHSARARLQLLAEQPRSPLRGMQGVIKACSEGNDRACAALAQHHSAVQALQDAQPAPARRARAPSLSPSLSSFSSSSSSKSFDLSANNGIWDPRNWQSGQLDTLGNVASNQWLAACGDGDARACRDIAKSGSALDNLLRSASRPGPPLQSYMKSKAPRAVYVAKAPPPALSKKSGLFSQALDFLGLGDDFDAQKGAPAVHMPKMVPDVGLHRGPKYSAVWNDGTVAAALSDQPGRRHIDTDSALHFFDDAQAAKPADQKWY